MKIAAFLIVGPGEADRMLEPVLRQLSWVDAVCVCLNNADKRTEEIVRKYSGFVQSDGREWGREQWRIKQDFLSAVIADVKPDWIWSLDADEIFDPRFDRAMAMKMAAGHDVAWYFWCLQLWNSDDRVRMDLSFPNIRFWKVVPELGLHFQATALHCGLAPMYAYKYGSQSGLYFKHYGLMKAEDRARKVARYDKYDPGSKYKGKTWYDGLRNERAGSLPLEEAIQRIPEFIHRSKPVRANRMAKDQTIFTFLNKHGKPVQAVGEKQRDQFQKSGMKELSEVKVNPHPEAPVVSAPEKKAEAAAASAGVDQKAEAPKEKKPRAPRKKKAE